MFFLRMPRKVRWLVSGIRQIFGVSSLEKLSSTCNETLTKFHGSLNFLRKIKRRCAATCTSVTDSQCRSENW